MNLSMKWLNEYVQLDNIDLHDFSEGMTMSGSKVEGYETEGSEISNVVVGKILSVDISPTERLVKDMETSEYVLAEVPWQKTAVIVLEADCNESDSTITTQEGFVVRGGDSVSAKGPGYAGKGYVLSVSRGDAA